MRYENLKVDFIDPDFLQFTDGEEEGDLVLSSTDELVDIVNGIRETKGYTDLVGLSRDNEVYYDFYLIFDISKRDISIQAKCNYGEKDDEVYYRLPMTLEEKENVMWHLIKVLAKEIYNS